MVKVTVDYNTFDIVPQEPIEVEEYYVEENELGAFFDNYDGPHPNSIKLQYNVEKPKEENYE